ncbi:MAG: NDP-sugar synthase [Candidatus Aenigmarchaeota archaeon]|nr:NDP-sugar synthase [Candidatus Aenigmarchaeota archaeon]
MINLTVNGITAISPLGGSGTRLYPLTLDTPKHLLPIGNRAIFHAATEYLAQQGIIDFILGVTGYRNRVDTHRFFGYGGRFRAQGLNPRIHYANYDDLVYRNKGSGDVFLWTLTNYRDLIGNNHVLLVNGDNLSNIDLGEFYEAHRQKDAVLTIAVKELEPKDPRLPNFGTVVFDSKTARVSEFVEKSEDPPSSYVNTAICLFSPEIYEVANSREMRDLMKELEETNKPLDVGGRLIPSLVKWGVKVFAYPLTGAWSDVGTPNSYSETTRDILYGEYPILHRMYVQRRGADWEALVHDDTVRRLGNRSERINFVGRCILGSNVTIGDGTLIQNSVIGDNAYIGSGVIIEETTLMPFTRVEDGVHIRAGIVGHNTIIGSNSVISPGAVLGDDLYIPPEYNVGIGQRLASTRHLAVVRRAGYKIGDELSGLEAFAFTP